MLDRCNCHVKLSAWKKQLQSDGMDGERGDQVQSVDHCRMQQKVSGD